MSTAPAPTGALSRRGTHAPTGRQTKPFDTIRHPAGRTRIGLVLGVLAVGVQLVFAVDALASGQIPYSGCVSSDASGGLCAETGAPALTGAISVAVSPDGTNVHVVASSGRALAVLNRTPAGQLTIAGCVSNEGSGGACADLPGAPLTGTNSWRPHRGHLRRSSESLISLAGTGPQPTTTNANSRIRRTG